MNATDLFAGIDYKADFVPQSKSRNAGQKELSLNWRVTITVGRQSLTTDYMQGIGHLPGYKQHGRTIADQECARAAVESGSLHEWRDSAGGAQTRPVKKLSPPTLREVLACLLLDASAIDAGSFEDWAAELGYDTDSRKAEAVYRDCVETGLKLRAMLGADRMQSLRDELAND